ncbi:MAG: hypothetical protein K2W86_00355 [Sphingomonas sp.]|uniref:hypothetical protein n=1 Tax=Sphingomonas sp. TaxID=28214 RepID=UPI0035A8955A|nr:hypothetical protein [Sphingomonas sp.]
MLPKKGKKLPVWEGALAGRQAYAEIIADLLRKEHGDSHRAVKQIMRQTGASERTIKHWLAANHGPDNVYLLRLIATSPVIRAFVLGVMEMDVRGRHSVYPGRSDHHASALNGRSGIAGSGQPARNDPINDPERDRISDPITEPLNQRQQWFLERVASGIRATAVDIVINWGVSPKTARRDIAVLRSAGLLHFSGARRNGRYRTV